MTLYNLMPWSKKSTPARRDEREHPVYSMQKEMNKLFEDFFSGEDSAFDSFGLTPFSSLRASGDPLTPKLDMSETENEMIVSLELPGIEEKDVEVKVSRDALVVSGEKRQEKSENEKGWYRMERHYGSFSRTIPLPCEFDAENVNASFKNGVLKVILPKTANQGEVIKKINVKKG